MTPEQTTDIMRTVAACWPDTTEADARIIREWCGAKDHEIVRRVIGTLKLRSLWNTVKPAELVNTYAVILADEDVTAQTEQRESEYAAALKKATGVHRESVAYLKRQDQAEVIEARDFILERCGSIFPEDDGNAMSDPACWGRMLAIWTHLQLERRVLA